MASRKIFTGLFKAFYTQHLHKAQEPQTAGQPPKYSVKMGFPQNGICQFDPTPGAASHQSIRDALDEVCMEVFQQPFSTFEDPAARKQWGIGFIAEFEDGNTKMARDTAGNPIMGQVDPQTAGFTFYTSKNEEAVPCAGPDCKDIMPSAIYSGCWCVAQLEVSAYINKNGGRVISTRLLAVQKAYDDVQLGGKVPMQSAASAFAGRAIANSNIPAGDGQAMMPIAPVAPVAPVAPAVIPGRTIILNVNSPYSADQLAGWTDQQCVDAGYATFNYLG